MQVKVIYEPFALADLYQPADVLVLPIFVSVELESLLLFDEAARIQNIRQYLKSRNIDVIALPENIVVLFVFVKKRHNKKRILKRVLKIYRASVSETYEDFDFVIPGMNSTLLCVASGDPLSDYIQMPKSKSNLSIYTGFDKLDRVYRRLIRNGDLERFTSDTLAHPTIRVSFERLLVRIAKENGFDVEIVNIVTHGRKAFITCDTMELEVS